MKRKHITSKLGFIFAVTILSLASISVSYSGWIDTIKIDGTVTTGEWSPCLCIRKILDGSFTDPGTGEDLDVPNYDLNLIHQSNNNDPGFPTKFKLTIEVVNNCDEDFTDFTVTDKIGNQVAPRQVITITHGAVTFEPYGFNRQEFGHDDMYWNIGVLPSGNTAVLVILIETLPNPSGKYEPTSEDQEPPVNDGGAMVIATSPDGEILSATTDGITLDIDPYDVPEEEEPNDHLAIIAAPQLPYATPWACEEDTLFPCFGSP